MKFLRLINQSDGGISLLKDVKMDMPYQRWFHPASPFTHEGLETLHPFTKPFERPEMKELFALMKGSVRTVRSSGSIFYGNKIFY